MGSGTAGSLTRARRIVVIDIGIDEHQVLDILEFRRRLNRWRRGSRITPGPGGVGVEGVGVGIQPDRLRLRRAFGPRAISGPQPAGQDDGQRPDDEEPEERRRGEGGLIDRMLVRGILNSGDTLSYAAALQVGEYKGLRTVEHGGALGGYRAQLLRFPDQHFSVICLCNLAPMNPTALAYRVADIYLADQLQATPEATVEEETPLERREPRAAPDFQPSATQMAEYPGPYYSEELDASWDLTTKENALYVVGVERPYSPVEADVFRLGGTVLRFVREADGRVVGLEVDAGRVRGINFVQERD